MRKIISFLLLSFVVYALQAQIKDPVKFKTELTALRYGGRGGVYSYHG